MRCRLLAPAPVRATAHTRTAIAASAGEPNNSRLQQLEERLERLERLAARARAAAEAEVAKAGAQVVRASAGAALALPPPRTLQRVPAKPEMPSPLPPLVEGNTFEGRIVELIARINSNNERAIAAKRSAA